MLEFKKAKHAETGRDVLVAQMAFQEVLDPLVLLRSLKATFPTLWDQVNLEMVIPRPVNGVNRILDANGKPGG